MLCTLLALLALVVTGGFISYFGDLQGRRWGKKRVSWFGMRPKHTAILITSLTGAGVALGSVAAVMIVSPTVRAVVLQGEAAINENRRRQEIDNKIIGELEVKVKTLGAQKDSTSQALHDQTMQNAQARADNVALKGDNDGLKRTNGELSHGNMELQQERAALQRGVETSCKQAAIQKKENENAAILNRELGRQNTELSRTNSNLTHANVQLKTVNSDLARKNQTLKTENDKLTSRNVVLKKTYDTANAAYNSALNDYSTLEVKYRDLEAKTKEKEEGYNNLTGLYGGMKTQVDELTQQRDELSNLLAGTSRNFVREYIALRQTRYKLRVDTELARRTLDAHLSPSAAREELLALLHDASENAKRYGAVVGDNGRAVVIVAKRVVTPASVQMADENASIDALVDSIAGSSTPVAVVARAINNSAANEQVIVELTPYTSTTVFDRDAVVATRTIDAHQPLDKLIDSVILFLKSDVRSAAVKAGTIPQISPDTGEQEVGTIDTAELVTLLDRIRRTGGSVQVTAVANEPITSADLLTFGQTRGGVKPHNLRLDLKRLPSAAARAASAAVAG